jgi:DNA-binding CsgD family transcriptional regulator
MLPYQKMEKEEKEKNDYALTDRELQILKFAIEQDSYKQTATKLFLNRNTVKKHIANIYRKLHVTSKARAI